MEEEVFKFIKMLFELFLDISNVGMLDTYLRRPETKSVCMLSSA